MSDKEGGSKVRPIASSWVADEPEAPDPDRDPAAPPRRDRERSPGLGNWIPVPWGPGEALLALVAVLVIGGVLTPVLVLPFDPELSTKAGLLAAQALFGIVMMAIAVMVASRWKTSGMQGALGRLGMRSFRPRQLAVGVGMLIAYYIVVALFASLVIEPEQDDIAAELGIGGGNVLIATLAVAAIVVLAPVAEELFFRGVLFAGLRSRLSVWPAAIISGVLFGGLHAVSGPTSAIPLALLGVLLALLYQRSGSIWPCIFIHALNNGVAVAVTS